MPRTEADNPQMGVAARRFLCLPTSPTAIPLAAAVAIELRHDEDNDRGRGATIAYGDGKNFSVVAWPLVPDLRSSGSSPGWLVRDTGALASRANQPSRILSVAGIFTRSRRRMRMSARLAMIR